MKTKPAFFMFNLPFISVSCLFIWFFIPFNATANTFNVNLSWDTTADIDLRVREPNGTTYDIDQGINAPFYGTFSVDDINGFGPETYTYSGNVIGSFFFSVQYHGNDSGTTGYTLVVSASNSGTHQDTLTTVGQVQSPSSATSDDGVTCTVAKTTFPTMNITRPSPDQSLIVLGSPSSVDCLGYNILRASNRNAQEKEMFKVNNKLLDAETDKVTELQDSNLEPSKKYFYRIQKVMSDGSTHLSDWISLKDNSKE